MMIVVETCPHCGDLTWCYAHYGFIVHKESCPYRKGNQHQGNTEPPEMTVASYK